jgi:hypothetical protein
LLDVPLGTCALYPIAVLLLPVDITEPEKLPNAELLMPVVLFASD